MVGEEFAFGETGEAGPGKRRRQDSSPNRCKVHRVVYQKLSMKAAYGSHNLCEPRFIETPALAPHLLRGHAQKPVDPRLGRAALGIPSARADVDPETPVSRLLLGVAVVVLRCQLGEYDASLNLGQHQNRAILALASILFVGNSRPHHFARIGEIILPRGVVEFGQAQVRNRVDLRRVPDSRELGKRMRDQGFARASCGLCASSSPGMAGVRRGAVRRRRVLLALSALPVGLRPSAASRRFADAVIPAFGGTPALSAVPVPRF